jgi:hypothetical protein
MQVPFHARETEVLAVGKSLYAIPLGLLLS